MQSISFMDFFKGKRFKHLYLNEFPLIGIYFKTSKNKLNGYYVCSFILKQKSKVKDR